MTKALPNICQLPRKLKASQSAAVDATTAMPSDSPNSSGRYESVAGMTIAAMPV